MSDLAAMNQMLADRDADGLRKTILASDFVLISVAESEDDDAVSALTAELGDFNVLVAFTSEARAKHFVQSMDELFEEDDQVDGITVEGNAMLDHLPEGFGLLLDPESDSAFVIDPSLASEVLQAS